jgi:hypothetical protein
MFLLYQISVDTSSRVVQVQNSESVEEADKSEKRLTWCPARKESVGQEVKSLGESERVSQKEVNR